MSRFFVILFCLFFSSCKQFQSTDKKAQELVEEELKAINWNEVDQFPLFDDCDESVSKEAQQECFKNTIYTNISSVLSDVAYNVNDTISQEFFIDFIVDEHGFIAIKEIEEHEAIANAIPGFYNNLNIKLKELATAKPAHKRGIPIKMKFRLPVTLSTQ